MENGKIRKEVEASRKNKINVSQGKTAISCKQRFFCSVKSLQYDVKLEVCCKIKIFFIS